MWCIAAACARSDSSHQFSTLLHTSAKTSKVKRQFKQTTGVAKLTLRCLVMLGMSARLLCLKGVCRLGLWHHCRQQMAQTWTAGKHQDSTFPQLDTVSEHHGLGGGTHLRHRLSLSGLPLLSCYGGACVIWLMGCCTNWSSVIPPCKVWAACQSRAVA